MFDFLPRCVLVILNYFALRWCARQLMADGQWLRDPEEREEERIQALREWSHGRTGPAN